WGSLALQGEDAACSRRFRGVSPARPAPDNAGSAAGYCPLRPGTPRLQAGGWRAPIAPAEWFSHSRPARKAAPAYGEEGPVPEGCGGVRVATGAEAVVEL